MTRGSRPSQPRVLGSPQRSGRGDGAASGPGPDDSDAPAAPRVTVNRQDKVAPLDPRREDEFEPVPTGGGRFSEWRRSLQLGTPGGSTRAPRPALQRAEAAPVRGRRRLRRVAVLLAALAAILLLVWAVFFSPLFAVRAVDVEGAQYSDPQAVARRLDDLHGVPMTRITEDDVMRRLQDLPQIRDLDASPASAHELRVVLQERVPVAAVPDGDGWAVVDREGVPLESAASREQLDVPVVVGEDGDRPTGDAVAAAGDVLATLPGDLLERVESAQAGSGGVVLRLGDDVSVRWGDASEAGLKAEVLSTLMSAQEQTGPVAVYDVSSPHRPVLG